MMRWAPFSQRASEHRLTTRGSSPLTSHLVGHDGAPFPAGGRCRPLGTRSVATRGSVACASHLVVPHEGGHARRTAHSSSQGTGSSGEGLSSRSGGTRSCREEPSACSQEARSSSGKPRSSPEGARSCAEVVLLSWRGTSTLRRGPRSTHEVTAIAGRHDRTVPGEERTSPGEEATLA
jgi:hypothetical protein